MKTKKQKLIEQYENMMIEYDMIDVFVDDILPKVNELSFNELKKMFDNDKQWYEYKLTV